MRLSFTTCIVILLIILPNRIQSQEIKVTEFRNDQRDISARENIICDANGDACGIIKIRTGLWNMKFYCDLGIQKTEIREGEYWLWVSPNTKQITISAEGFKEVPYKLPAFLEKYNVYVITIIVIFPENIVYNYIKSTRISTKPKNAEIFVDKIFMGYSPLDLNIPNDSFHYEIRKKKYISISEYVKNTSSNSEYNFHLRKNPEANRFFIGSYISGGSGYGISLGITAGFIGNTSWYISTVPPLRSKKTIGIVHDFRMIDYFEVDKKNFTSITGKSPDDFLFSVNEDTTVMYNHFRIKAGITQKLFRNFYMKAGVGYALFQKLYQLSVVPNSNDPSLKFSLAKLFYGKEEFIYDNDLFVIEMGLIYRIHNNYLLEFNLATTGFKYAEDGNLPKFSGLLYPIEGSIGLAYRF